MTTWRARIQHAKKQGKFSTTAKRRSGHWRTCAVGEQHRTHPEIVVLGPRFAPTDPTLERLGHDFAVAVYTDGSFATAEQILDAIEDRVLELKREKQDAK